MSLFDVCLCLACDAVHIALVHARCRSVHVVSVGCRPADGSVAVVLRLAFGPSVYCLSMMFVSVLVPAALVSLLARSSSLCFWVYFHICFGF